MLKSSYFVYLLLCSAALLMVFCNREVTEKSRIGAYLNMADDVKYVGKSNCITCHANIYETYKQTGMGRSFDRATPQKSDATYGDHALVYDEASDFYYRPYFQNDSLFVMEFRLSGKDTTHKRIEYISYIVGSGQHTNSHIIDINGYIFQAPITYYTQEERWDMAPGFEKENLRFSRWLNTECLTCHNHYPGFVEGSLNKFTDMPSGIECERCHGPGEIHLAQKMAGEIVDTSQFIDYSIVNPRDLPRERQMDLCQRCHLQGVAVLEKDKSFFDFKPGMKLSEVMNVFLPRYTNNHDKFIMASQADRLRMSKCYQLSEDLSCLSCHHPHHSVASTSKDQFNNSCKSCHPAKAKNDCSLSEAERLGEDNNCVACHMPRSGSIDIPHVNITDHYISKTTVRRNDPDIVSEEKQEEIARFLGLEILTKAKATDLDMARGYIALYDKYVTKAMMLDSAKYYLERSNQSFEALFEAKVHYYFASQSYEALIQLAQQQPIDSISDAWTFYRIGEAYFKNADYPNALQYYEKATEYKPFSLDFQEKLGNTYVVLQQLDKATRTFEFILKENDKRQIALCNLGYVYVLQQQWDKGEALYDQALQLDPDYVQAMLNKAAVRLYKKDWSAARGLLERILALQPNHPQARQVLAQLETMG